MTERKTEERRNWKGIVFPYDRYIPDESKECLYCLTSRQAEIIRGAIEPLGWATRWWSETSDIDKDQLEAFRDDIIRRLMMPCGCDDVGIIFQYTSGGVLQQSEDGGTTWVDVPEKDTRNNSPRFPQPPDEEGVDEKCVAANSAATLIKEQVGDQLTDDMTRYTLGQLITDWVKTLINSSNPLLALLTVISNQIFALVIATLRPALTDDVYHKLQCALYNNMADDISFSDGGWSAARSDILTNITGIAGVFLEHLIFLIGVGGLTNLVRAGAGSSSADCSDCVECLCPFDEYVLVGTYVSCDGNAFTIDSADDGDGHQMVYLVYGAGTTHDVNACRAIDHYEVLSGSVLVTGWVECVTNTLRFDGVGGCACDAFWQNNVSSPFTVKVFYADCADDCG